MLLAAFLCCLVFGPAIADSASVDPLPFVPGGEVLVGQRDGLVTLRTIEFKVSETKLSATALVFCDKGKDQKVDLQITLLDAEGNRVALITGKGKVEEKQKNKIRFGSKVEPGLLDAVDSFQVTLQTYPD
jgi:hypothetical protein